MSDVSEDTSLTITDTPKIILFLFLSIVAVGCSVLFFYWAIFDSAWSVMAVANAAVALLFFMRFWVNVKGYILALDEGGIPILKFPGGGIGADSWLSHFNPMHWLQGFKRHQVSLLEMHEIELLPDNRLELTGDFGAITFNFLSKHKANLLYNEIAGGIQAMAEVIESDADINATGEHGFTELMIAIMDEGTNPKTIAALIKNSADVNERIEEGEGKGGTALMFAAAGHTNPYIITALIKNGADVNARAEDGTTALMLAAAGNANPEIITVLIKNGADINAKNDSGMMAIDFARDNIDLVNTNAIRELQPR